MSSDICQMAQNLARACGYHVFPVLENKAPATPNGFKAASADPAEIGETWRRWPGDLIGVATGQVSNVDVLDIDVKHEIAANWWTVASKRVPPTRIYRTRSGGFHVYFKHAPGSATRNPNWPTASIPRGSGGYVIHWYSAGFDCLDHSPPAPWPIWLRDCLLWQPPKVVRPANVASPKHADKAIEGVLRHVATAREGERNAILYLGACRLKERVEAGQLGQGEATTLLVNTARSIGLQDVEAQRTVSSAWRAA